MAYFTYQEKPIHYTLEGEGPALMFIHGLGGNAINWLNQRNLFKKGYQVITPDLPGHGKSKESADIPFEDYHLVLKTLLDQLGIDSVTLCGISMGGRVAIDFAYYHPERVRGLVLADTFAGLEETEIEKGREIFALLNDEDGIDKWINRVIEAMGIDPDSMIARGFHKGMEQNNIPFIQDLFYRLQSYDQRDKLASIEVPALILHGERDRFIPYSSAEELHRKLPDGELHVIPESGHLPHVEKPKQFNEILQNFLDRLP
ncbi:MAG: alpha/beta hydrolase [Bacillaceae bacterium]|nr:alpha/beta hydrolase [Bacillaceae bacterium]